MSTIQAKTNSTQYTTRNVLKSMLLNVTTVQMGIWHFFPSFTLALVTLCSTIASHLSAHDSYWPNFFLFPVYTHRIQTIVCSTHSVCVCVLHFDLDILCVHVNVDGVKCTSFTIGKRIYACHSNSKFSKSSFLSICSASVIVVVVRLPTDGKHRFTLFFFLTKASGTHKSTHKNTNTRTPKAAPSNPVRFICHQNYDLSKIEYS